MAKEFEKFFKNIQNAIQQRKNVNQRSDYYFQTPVSVRKPKEGSLADAFTDILGLILLGLAAFVLLMPTGTRAAPGPSERSLRALPLGGAFVGFLSGTFAVGGGLVTLPILARVRRLAPHRAAATTSATAMLGTLGGAIGHTIAGNVVWSRAVVLIGGAVLGSSIGARVAGRLAPRVVLALVAAGLVGAGVPLLIAA